MRDTYYARSAHSRRPQSIHTCACTAFRAAAESSGITHKERQFEALEAFIVKNDVQQVETLLASHSELVNAPSPLTSETPLHIAARSNNKEMLNALLSKGANARALTSDLLRPVDMLPSDANVTSTELRCALVRGGRGVGDHSMEGSDDAMRRKVNSMSLQEMVNMMQMWAKSGDNENDMCNLITYRTKKDELRDAINLAFPTRYDNQNRASRFVDSHIYIHNNMENDAGFDRRSFLLWSITPSGLQPFTLTISGVTSAQNSRNKNVLYAVIIKHLIPPKRITTLILYYKINVSEISSFEIAECDLEVMQCVKEEVTVVPTIEDETKDEQSEYSTQFRERFVKQVCTKLNIPDTNVNITNKIRFSITLSSSKPNDEKAMSQTYKPERDMLASDANVTSTELVRGGHRAGDHSMGESDDAMRNTVNSMTLDAMAGMMQVWTKGGDNAMRNTVDSMTLDAMADMMRMWTNGGDNEKNMCDLITYRTNKNDLRKAIELTLPKGEEQRMRLQTTFSYIISMENRVVDTYDRLSFLWWSLQVPREKSSMPELTIRFTSKEQYSENKNALYAVIMKHLIPRKMFGTLTMYLYTIDLSDIPLFKIAECDLEVMQFVNKVVVYFAIKDGTNKERRPLPKDFTHFNERFVEQVRTVRRRLDTNSTFLGNLTITF